MNTLNEPKVSVLMPVYNGEAYVEEAIKSVLSQTYQNFEFIVINDGSTDRTAQILDQFAERIILVSQENSGIVASLNKGIALAKGQYIARFDADDKALSNRLEVQANFLDEHPEYGVVGSACRLIDSRGKFWGIQKVPLTHEEIEWTALFNCPFIHPTVMFRKQILLENNLLYRKEFTSAEDYDLWVQFLKYSRGFNFDQPLVNYRIHGKNVTITKNEEMFRASKLISEDAITYFAPQIIKENDFAQISKVQEVILSNASQYKNLSAIRIRSIIQYIHFWKLYLKNNLIPKQIKKVIERKIVIRSCQIGFFPPVPPDFTDLIKELFSLSPNWVLIFLSSIPMGLSAYIRKRFLWKWN